jgi:hypothetical protein
MVLSWAPDIDRAARGAVDYKIAIQTSDISGAGTDAAVFIDIQGKYGGSGRCAATHIPTSKYLNFAK